MINNFSLFIKTDLGQVISFSVSIIGLLITLITFISVLNIRDKIKKAKKSNLCISDINEIIGILDKNKNDFSLNPSDIDDRIRSTNEQILRNYGVIKSLKKRFLLKQWRLRNKNYIHFLKIYKEIIIDLEREEI
ncbi:hypothetical protein K7J14_14945 [Treponema zuelzerae]|uniref:Uncharacterized protein n=1 Tax=Teretinema zuelzerae TaxID=156 RepID=A0AAE3JMS4_9SPIR|nr:hypothetical protein [Teretinema zuelzerae]MCD1655994.1 hypothetical protein [Teretinema zuelzerae]